MKTIELNEQQVEFLKTLLANELDTSGYSNTSAVIMNQLIIKLKE